ncbi:MAG: ATP-binding protein [Stappiaceae bacterium]
MSADDITRVVLCGLRAETDSADLCRREGISPQDLARWTDTFIAAGKQQLSAKLIESDRSGSLFPQMPAVDLLSDTIESLSEGVALFDENDRLVLFNSRQQQHIDPEGTVLRIGGHLADMTRALVHKGAMVPPEGVSADEFADLLLEAVRDCAKEVDVPASGNRHLLGSAHHTPLGGRLITIEDITEKRHAEQAEREADMLLRKIVEACPTTFLVSRVSDGKIIYYPPASRDRFGEIETTLSFFLNPEDRETYLAALLPTGNLNDYRVRFRRADGSIMEGLTAARVTDYKGEDVIVSATRDISEQLAMQAELEHQREVAHQNEKLSALGELLAGVAHELNNPLSIVVGYALMLQQKIDDPKQRRQLERIGDAAERCAKIVKTFLAMARQRPANIEASAISDIIEMAVDVAGYSLKASGARIVLDLDSDLPLVGIDRDQMAQVFTNLIVNAEHALEGLREKGTLTIRAYGDHDAGLVKVEVTDNGKGMTPEIQARIFEPFFTTKDVGTGTGVGLAFCHRIISAHGGTLTVRSQPGRGACFMIGLTVADPVVASPDIKGEEVKQIVGHQVLIVDDEVGVADLMREILEEAGYEVTVENDARTALGKLKFMEFDAILSDFKMPGLDGAAFFNELRKISPRHAERIAFVTGDAMSERVGRFIEAAAVRYLEKPIVPTEVIRLVEELGGQSEGGSE